MICPKSLESTRVRARTSKVSALSERVHQESSSRTVVRARPALYLEKQAWATDASAQERHTKMGSGTKANGTAGRVQACVCVVDCGFGGGREVWRVAMLPLALLFAFALQHGVPFDSLDFRQADHGQYPPRRP